VIHEATKHVNSLDKYQVVAGKFKINTFFFLPNLRIYFLLGYVSPCHSAYANGKLGQYSISTKHRLNMIHLAIQSFEHWMTDLFECYADKHMEMLEYNHTPFFY